MHRRTGILLALTAAACVATPADGYRFFARHGGLHRIASVAGAIRWDESAFPLRFRLLENGNLPDVPGFDAALWRESAERGIRAWVAIETADLAIVLEEETVAADQGRMGDGINTIGFSSLESVAGGPFATADVQYTHGRVTGCDVHFSPSYLEGRSLDAPTAFEELADYLARTVMHEVGHCLGLAHSAMNPTWLARPDAVARRPGYFPDGVTSVQPHPRMSYGTIRTVVLEPDDVVGASLLYPAPGFVESRGALTGRVVLADGEPAPYVYVQAVAYGPDGAIFGAGAFTDSWGQFLLEGLEPGFRHFWIRPLHQLLAHSFIGEVARAGSLELQHEQRWFEIRRGEIVRAPDITVHPARRRQETGS
jgi:hypothetical protein